MSGYLWIEVAGIQDYLFATDDLREIAGASALVEDFTSSIPKGLLPPQAKLVFSGGGHCLIESPSSENLHQLARKVQELVWTSAPALQLRTFLYEPTGKPFGKAMAELHKSLLYFKAETPKTYYLPPLSISRVSPDTGYPSVGQDPTGRDFSLDQVAKRRRFQEADGAADEVEDLDHLVLREGESTIGIVHIDGNDLGKALRDQQNSEPELRAFSESVRTAFRRAWNRLKSEIPLVTGAKKNSPDRRPVRLLLQGGDDLTFAAAGPYALHWAARYLELLDLPLGKGACAGVAIIKRKTPIRRGFDWAHALCQNAKTRRKQFLENGVATGSWIDWEIEWREDLGQIASYRRRKYSAGGTIVSPGTGFDSPLCWRPLQVVGQSPLHSWASFQQAYLQLNSLPRGPRERILHSLFDGPAEAENQSLALASRKEMQGWPNLELGALKFSLDQPFVQGASPYADLLEASLYFLPQLPHPAVPEDQR